MKMVNVPIYNKMVNVPIYNSFPERANAYIAEI